MKHKILIVDDEPANLRMLERLFRDDHEVITAESGAVALERLAHNDVALIISDQRMPGMTGIEFLKRATETRPQTVKIILTGYTDVDDVVEAVNSEIIYKYITKPWVNSDLVQTVKRSIEHFEARKKRSLLEQENERLDDRLKRTVQGFLSTAKEMIAQKSSSLAEHCQRTSEFAAMIGSCFKLETWEMEQLTAAALLHELPNIRIGFEMEFNRSALTPAQLRVTRDEYENGLRIISDIPDLVEVASIICYQHENYDGTGFFEGLEGEKIPLLSRILAVANAFDEINWGRSAALFYSAEEAAEWLRSRAGSKYDPQIIDACLAMGQRETPGLLTAIQPNYGPRVNSVAVL